MFIKTSLKNKKLRASCWDWTRVARVVGKHAIHSAIHTVRFCRQKLTYLTILSILSPSPFKSKLNENIIESYTML